MSGDDEWELEEIFLKVKDRPFSKISVKLWMAASRESSLFGGTISFFILFFLLNHHCS